MNANQDAHANVEQGKGNDECEEVHVVALSDTVAQPGAMMVEFLYAIITNRAMPEGQK